jgi:drug/metabolite transporter (DMT)-like permease
MSSTGLFHLGVVYLLWGSTFLAIRVAVREGSGFPPFTMGATRVLTAGLILLLIARLRGKRIVPTRAELPVLVGSGLLLWTAGNGLVTWAEQRAASGLAALMIGTVPIWVSLYEAYLDRRPPSALLLASLLTALTGIGLLSAPVLTSGVQRDALSILGLALAAMTWAAGTVWQGRRKIQLGLQASSAYQHLAGGLGFLVVSRLVGEPVANPVPEAWGAWAYLVIFGSLIGYTSYIQTLRLLPISVATTNAYVNPVIALGLGSLLLQEQLSPVTLAGAALVLAGVAGVFRDRFGPKPRVVVSGGGE